jgi:hypothetical protein
MDAFDTRVACRESFHSCHPYVSSPFLSCPSNSGVLGLFIDGNLVDSQDVAYPRLENSYSTAYHIGDESNNAQASWSMASAYLITMPMGNELPRLFHHLGPRYFSNFQSSPLVRFFTYEAATSLSIYLQSLMDAKRTPSPELSMLLKGGKEGGPSISEDTILFAITPAGYQDADENGTDVAVLNSALRKDRVREKARIKGDVAVVKPQCLDSAVWKIGGAAIPLRLVELSQVKQMSITFTLFTKANQRLIESP